MAAAVSLEKPADALKLVKQGRESPHELYALEVDKKLILPLLRAAKRSQPDGGELSDEARAAAAAIRADPARVAAVQAEIEAASNKEKATEAGLRWVARIDVELLDAAARSGAREKGLDLIPTTQGEIQDLKDRVGTLETKVNALETRVGELAEKLEKTEKQS